MKTIFLVFLNVFSVVFATAQNAPNRKALFEVLPTFGQTPETGTQLGVNFFGLLDFAKGDTTARTSRFYLWAFYTTKNQYGANGSWQIFTQHERINSSGNAHVGLWVDRYYPVSNKANARVIEYRGGKPIEFNYANYLYSFANFSGNFDRKIAPHFFAGLSGEFDVSYDSKFQADSLSIISGKFDLKRNDARRVGIGVNLIYDTRDIIENPLKGTNISLTSMVYRKFIGSTVNYQSVVFDARQYIHTFKNQTLALRLVNEYHEANDKSDIPLRGLSYNGGVSTIRGYYQGTFRSNNLLGFETEYRLPINIVDDAEFFEFWKRIGIVGFASAVKVSRNYSNLYTGFGDFHVALGVGVRYALHIKQRINVSVDYAVGLDKIAGQGIHPTGLYFALGEAF